MYIRTPAGFNSHHIVCSQFPFELEVRGVSLNTGLSSFFFPSLLLLLFSLYRRVSTVQAHVVLLIFRNVHAAALPPPTPSHAQAKPLGMPWCFTL